MKNILLDYGATYLINEQEMKVVKKSLLFNSTWLGAVVGLITIPLMTLLFPPEELGRATMFTLALNVLMLFTMFGID